MLKNIREFRCWLVSTIKVVDIQWDSQATHTCKHSSYLQVCLTTNNENSYSLFKYEKENLSGKYKLHVAFTTESEFKITLKFREFLQVSLLQDNLRKH